MNKKNILFIVIMSSVISNLCYSNTNHTPMVYTPGIHITENTVYIADGTDPKGRVTHIDYLQRGEPIVIVQDTKEKSGNISIYSQENLKRNFFGGNKFDDTNNTHAYFTRCNGFSVIEERDKYSLHANKKQQFNPCENIRIKMAVKSFLKEELETKKLQKILG
jgi:hypothetical protein